MRFQRLRSLAVVLALGTAAMCGDKKADDGLPEPHTSPTRFFRVPVCLEDDALKKLARIRLFVSTDEGKTWKKAGEEKADDSTVFSFTAPTDGEYWFAVQSVDKDGKTEPKDARKLRPQMRVVVDTHEKA